jgi:hypothetical protein
MPTPTSGPVLVKPTANRSFDFLVTANAGLTAFTKGHLVHAGASQIAQSTGELFSQVCFVEPCEVHFSANKILDPIVHRGWPTEIEFVFGPRAAPPQRTTTLTGMQRLMVASYAHAFVTYYAAIENDIRAKYSDDAPDWPRTLDFGRVVRNGLAHGGIRIDSAKRAFSWRGLAYSAADNGRPLLYNDVTQGDLTLLMLDMDELL